MLVNVNGTPREVPEGATVADLIQILSLGKNAVAAEVNQRLVPKRDHPNTPLREGDKVELVSLVGGG